MKYIKNFESIRSEYPDMFAPTKPEDEPKLVPGFEDGTIDPEDTEPWIFNGETHEAESERYKEFIKIVKERNFTETDDEIIINIRGITQDYCMSIYNFPKHLRKFLENELIGKYISKGLVDVMSENVTSEDNTQVQGIIRKILFYSIDNYDCSVLMNFDVYSKDHAIKNTVVLDTITIDKLKSATHKYNL